MFKEPKVIIIRSLARSGSIFLLRNLEKMSMPTIKYGFVDFKNFDLDNYDESFFKMFEEFVKKSDLNKAKQNIFDYYRKNTISVLVLRNPIECIKSDITMNLYNNRMDLENVLSIIDNLVDVHIENITKINENIDKFVPFTFEQLYESTEKVIENIHKQSRSQTEFKYKEATAVDDFYVKNTKDPNGKFKYLSSSKNSKYYKYVESEFNEYKNLEKIDLLINIYNKTILKIYERQSALGIVI